MVGSPRASAPQRWTLTVRSDNRHLDEAVAIRAQALYEAVDARFCP
jgi:hypothetical protein